MVISLVLVILGIVVNNEGDDSEVKFIQRKFKNIIIISKMKVFVLDDD